MYSKRVFYLLSCFPFIAFLVSYSITHVYMNRGTLTTPHLLGIDILHAAELVSPAKMNLRILGNKIEPDLPIGTILHQHPMAGTHIKENQTIFVVTSLQPEGAQMPYTVGLSKQAVDELITPLGIRKKYVYLASDHPAGSCFAQFPTPGSSLNGCELMIFLIAQNHLPMLWPDVRDLSVYEADEHLKIHDIPFTISHKEQMPPEHVCNTRCFVVRQNPAPGTLLITSDKIISPVALEVIFR